MMQVPGKGHLMSKTVLIVDDEMLICLDIQMHLDELGHRTLVASTYAQAAHIIETEHVDIAVVDWHLGKVDASALVDALRQKKVPFVLCSGSTQEELAARFPKVPVVPKPFMPAQLFAAFDIAGKEAAC